MKVRNISPRLPLAAKKGVIQISQRNSSLKTDDTTRPVAAAKRPQVLGEKTFHNAHDFEDKEPSADLPAYELSFRQTDRYVVECVSHVHDEPVHGAVKP